MKKITLLILTLFVLSIVIPMTVMAKDTTPAKVKKVVKKSDETVIDPTVYIKENGKKFHKRNCKLVSGKKGIKLSEATKKGYEPCKICFKTDNVYITEKGKKYHKKDCKLVKDTKAIQIGIAKEKGLEPCKICFPPAKLKKDLNVKKK
ncbi:MAG: hypothetical protein ABFR36_04580 [Acidobacteriota bacterium]